MKFYLLLFFLVVSLFAPVAPAQAQEVPLTAESSAGYTFGERIDFALRVQNGSDLQTITLFFRPELSPNIYEVQVPFQPEARAASEDLFLTQPVDANALGIRPFSDITYWWELETGEGALKVPEKKFIYEDNRLDWQIMVRDGVTAHWTGGGPLMGQSVLDTVDRSLSDLLAILPLARIDALDVYVYPSSADLRESLQAAGALDQPAGQFDLGVVVVTSVNPQTIDSDLAQSLPYELAQLLIFRTAGEQVAAIPWWLREGIAGSARPNESPRQLELLAEAIKFEDTIPLWRLCSEQQDGGDRQELAAAQSTSLLRFVASSQSPGAIRELVTAYVAGDDCEQGVERVLGLTLDELQQAWLDDQVEPNRLNAFLGSSGLWIILLLAGTLLVGILIYSTRARK